MQQKDPVQADLIWQRRIRTGRYIYEDYREAIQKTEITVAAYFLLGIVYLVSYLICDTDNLPYFLVNIIGGTSLLFIGQLYVHRQTRRSILILMAYVFFVGLEYLLFGLPDALIPESDTYEPIQLLNEINVINLLTLMPLLYFPLKIILLHPLWVVIYQEKKVIALSDNIKQEVGIPIV